MQQQLLDWARQFNQDYASLASLLMVLGLILIVALILHLFLHKILLPSIEKRGLKAGSGWQHQLTQYNLFNRIAFIIQGIVVNIQSTLWLSSGSTPQMVLNVASQAWCLLFGLLTIYSILDITLGILQRAAKTAHLPLRGIFQSIKLIATVLISIMIIALLIGKSPLIILSGLGAMTAVMMLVFKDPIMGLVAGIQLSANNMVNIGDWLEMPKYGADGAVIDIGLTTVKVRNWDNTVTTIPTYALISDSFKNWKGMTESGGRRIKRSLRIDANSIHFLQPEEIKNLEKANLLEPYLDQKVSEIQVYNSALPEDKATPLNQRRLTNIGTFRAYVEAYLRAHPQIHKNMTIMVRQLESDSNGIPIEIYAFTNTTVWLEYERIQSDIFDHIFSILPQFNLHIHQSPTGNDVRFLSHSTIK
ncbi:Miniconductance mechanosensitive channel YbdG [Providencia alcalifaciens]|uniref:Mechanosensing system component YbdG n=1 Tax=Providencia alcalifaciens 205/92 TaxID=1256988 RepID=A0AAV3M6X1_9GAMM|nr:mechanosensitive ion channel family protein [Providencia alcalifaciens]EUD02314.1 transporter, small conductance mechanosensitive ion channel MscS family protein [Providencia alcalifaciens RIMD 1656011]EUD11490.1 transporter, small conductance mechanosensitive ion channel MscS family protein [Providencia alcalifaciens 205/92]MTC14579.1 mechanosensitive ion channel [Providencia alcalifaciens]MTC63973.1 mechanosensitive ion channel [Providencia alcalifaciens]WGZ54258.1 mechanosensitive ion ch